MNYEISISEKSFPDNEELEEYKQRVKEAIRKVYSDQCEVDKEHFCDCEARLKKELGL